MPTSRAMLGVLLTVFGCSSGGGADGVGTEDETTATASSSSTDVGQTTGQASVGSSGE